MPRRFWTAIRSHRRTETWAGVAFLTPSFLALSAFIFFPLVYLLYLSLLNWNLLTPAQFVGFANFAHLLHSPYFMQAVQNTLVFTLGVIVLLIPTSFAAAFFLNSELQERAVYRAIVLAPYVFPLVASGIAWSLMFQPQSGIINWFLAQLHLTGPDWLSYSPWALVAIIIVTGWQYFGFYSLIFLAGLQGLPVEILEAAEADGAGGWRKFFHITLPLMSPSLFFALVILVIQSFQVFTQVFVMTNGGPGSSTTTIVFYLYQEGWQYFQIGRAAAVGVLLLFGLVTMTLLQVWASRKWVYYET